MPGGQSASAAVGCARLGWKTQYIGAFGDDDAARIGIESLERDQVDTSLVRRVRGATSHTSLVLVDARSGDRTVIWHRDPRLAMSAADVPVGAIGRGRVLLVDDHEPLAATVAARAAREAGVRTVIDVEKLRPGTEELLQHIDIIIAAEAFPSELTGVPDLGAALREMARRFEPAHICATLGPKGSLSLVDGKEVRTPAFDVHVEDTTGAGDAFRVRLHRRMAASRSRSQRPRRAALCARRRRAQLPRAGRPRRAAAPGRGRRADTAGVERGQSTGPGLETRGLAPMCSRTSHWCTAYSGLADRWFRPESRAPSPGACNFHAPAPV